MNWLKDLFSYTYKVLTDTIMKVILLIDLLGVGNHYLPTLLQIERPLPLPGWLLWLLPLIGFYWSSFQLYRSSSRNEDLHRPGIDADRQAYQALLEIMPPEGTIQTLREYDFGGPFDMEWMQDMFRFLNTSDRPNLAFIDQEIEEQRQILVESTRHFNSRLGVETFPLKNHHRRLNRIPVEMSYQDPERYRNLIEELNELSDNVVQEYDRLVILTRRKLF